MVPDSARRPSPPSTRRARAAAAIVAVGTTSLRALESAADDAGRVRAGEAETRLFITPGYRFRVVDRLLTNFHLPKSTLLMLVSAFAGYENIRAAYAHAIARALPLLQLRRRDAARARAAAADAPRPRRFGRSREPASALRRACTRRCYNRPRCNSRCWRRPAARAAAGSRLAHGAVETPVFMPVGTYGTVKAMAPSELDELGAQIVLGNTFHLWLRPGVEVIAAHRRAASLHGLARGRSSPTPAASRSGASARCARCARKA